jgi:perosamine synthetase
MDGLATVMMAGVFRPMWPRKQLDMGWIDFVYAAGQMLWPAAQPSDESVVGDGWIPAGEALVSLSVRSAWDLLLAALQLPPGSEIIMSAVTVPDMARIVRHHELVPVPIDVDPAGLEPVIADLENAITPRTRAILVAHLFGSRIDMTPIVELAGKHNLLVVEDCAQAYVGSSYAGHPGSDVALFSFGPIKTATALGGAISRVRDAALLAEMARRQRDYPVQTRRSYLSRLIKFMGIRLFTTRFVYGASVAYFRWRGVDYDRKIAGLARSFAADSLLELIRRRPCAPLVRMLEWRLATHEGSTATRLRRRAFRSGRVAASLACNQVIGGENPTHTYWVFPIRVDDPDEVVEALQQAGFDATRLSSLVVVPFPDTNPVAAAMNGAASNGAAGSQRRLATWLDDTVFLPNCDAMPDAEFQRMKSVLAQVIGVEVPAPSEKRERPEPAPTAIAS